MVNIIMIGMFNIERFWGYKMGFICLFFEIKKRVKFVSSIINSSYCKQMELGKGIN